MPIPKGLKRQLDDYIREAFNRGAESRFWRSLGRVGYSAGEKRAAAEALKRVIEGSVEASTLHSHGKALQQGRLGKLYSQLQPHIVTLSREKSLVTKPSLPSIAPQASIIVARANEDDGERKVAAAGSGQSISTVRHAAEQAPPEAVLSSASGTVLPNDTVRDILFPYLEPNRQEAELAAVCSVDFFDDSYAIQTLVSLVLHGEEAKARAMLAANPSLLLKKTHKPITAEGGRTYNTITAYQAALYCGDVQMAKMMHAFFEKLDDVDGEEIRRQQVDEVFPDGVDAVFNAQVAFDFEPMMQTIAAATPEQIRHQLENPRNTDTELGQAFNAFRAAFAACISEEKHVNLKHMLRIFEIYARAEWCNTWEENHDWNRLDVVWCQVIGFVQRYLPACDKQIFHQGLWNFVQEDSSVNNRLRFFKFDDTCSTFGREVSSFDLGYKWAVAGSRFPPSYPSGPVPLRGAGGAAWFGRDGSLSFQNICQTKTSGLQGLCSRSHTVQPRV